MKKLHTTSNQYSAILLFDYAPQLGNLVYNLKPIYNAIDNDIFFQWEKGKANHEYDSLSIKNFNIGKYDSTYIIKIYLTGHYAGPDDTEADYISKTLSDQSKTYSYKDVGNDLCKFIPKNEPNDSAQFVISLIICSAAKKLANQGDDSYFETWAGKLHTFLAKRERYVTIKARTRAITIDNSPRTHYTSKHTITLEDEEKLQKALDDGKNISKLVNKVEKHHKQPGSKIKFYCKLNSNNSSCKQIIEDSYTKKLLISRELDIQNKSIGDLSFFNKPFNISDSETSFQKLARTSKCYIL